MEKNPFKGFIGILIFGAFVLTILESSAILRLFSNYSSGKVINISSDNKASNLALNMKDSFKTATTAKAEKVNPLELAFQENKAAITFLCKTFGVSEEAVTSSLRTINSDGAVNPLNIGRVGDASFSSFDRGLVEYLFVYIEKNPGSVNNTYVPYNGGKDYVEKLIKYFSYIYDDVDYLTAISIGAAESGYYTVKYMLNKNNIFGGMGSNGLVQYKSIEYGTLSFIKLLHSNYYSKGLTSLESIGRVYCPVASGGGKIASPHWINLVNKAKSHYGNTTKDVKAENLLND